MASPSPAPLFVLIRRAVKPIEHARHVLRRDARPLVPHAEPHEPSAPASPRARSRRRPANTSCVREQIHEHVPHAAPGRPIARSAATSGATCHRRACGSAGSTSARASRARSSTARPPKPLRRFERGGARLQPREVQQIIEDAEQPVRVVARRFQQLALRRRSALRAFAPAADRPPCRRLVSGVFSSWLTVPTRLLLASSSSRNFVTSCSTIAAPRKSVSLSPIARMRGR
jgi:hypothetical protein